MNLKKIISEQEILVSSEVNAPESSGECEPLKLQPTASPSDMLDNSEGTELEALIAISDSSFIEDNCVLSDTGCQDDVNGVATHSSSIVISDQQIDTLTFQNAQIDHAPVQTQDSVEDFQEPCLSISHKDVLLSELESKTAEVPSSEEPIMMIEAPRKHMQRSFTLEEATDTILFCSYIARDMAYKAATIGMEKELATYESSHRRVTYLGSSVSNQKNLQKTSNKRIQISQKVKLKKLEIAGRMPSAGLGINVKNSEFACHNTEVPHTIDSTKPPMLESKCNCTVMSEFQMASISSLLIRSSS